MIDPFTPDFFSAKKWSCKDHDWSMQTRAKRRLDPFLVYKTQTVDSFLLSSPLFNLAQIRFDNPPVSLYGAQAHSEFQDALK
ncbi:hypothetical protein ACFL5W_01540 [Thermodesulfobacteriota bacterium]